MRNIETRTRIFVIFWILVFSITNSTTSVTGQTVKETNQDDVIIYAMPYDFDEYSVYTADSYATAQWNSAVYAALLKRNSVNHDWEPDLALNLPTISNNGLTFTFTLKENLTFSNGHELDADDVEFSLHAALTPKVNRDLYKKLIGYFNNDSINIIESKIVEFTFLNQSAFPRSLLAFPIVDKQFFEKRYNRCLDGVEEDCKWNDPNGTDNVSAGPFMVEDIDNEHEIVTVIANPYYYDAENIFTDKIIFQKIANKDSAVSALSAGIIDILDSQYVPGVDELIDIEGIREDFAGDPAHQEFALNHLNPYFGTGGAIPGNENATDQEKYADALLVREALSRIVNREYAKDTIMQGLARTAATSMPDASIGFDETLVPREYSIETAIRFMEWAGFDYMDLGTENNDGSFNNFFFEIVVMKPVTGGGRRESWADGFVENLPKIGIGVKEYVETGWGEIIPRTFGYDANDEKDPAFPLPPSHEKGGFDIFAVGYGWALDWNPGLIYDSAGRCDTGNCDNFYNFDVEEQYSDVALFVRCYLEELDFDDRMQKVKILQQELYDNIPVLPILYPRSHWGFNDKIEGIDTLLLSVSAQDWGRVKKGDFEQNQPVFPATPSSSDPSSVNTLFIIGGIGLIVIMSYRKNRR
ncbi:MAG: ABC transporter substrate-binding protein [Candidatus Heimdallarchaeota archaeon]|nr:ABC transporter substrate-binding protein [Candidatus Heimdallarchaeota archaeon]